MDVVDALLFALLAAGDMALIVFLRKRHNRQARLERMARCLAESVRRELRKPAPRPRLRVGPVSDLPALRSAKSTELVGV